MPFALVTIGLLMLVIGARGTYQEFGSQLYGDLFGSGNQRGFIWWILAIVLIGLVGYAPRLKPLSHALLILVIVVILLANRGVAANLISAVQQGPAPVAAHPLPPASINVTLGSLATGMSQADASLTGSPQMGSAVAPYSSAFAGWLRSLGVPSWLAPGPAPALGPQSSLGSDAVTAAEIAAV
jgi:hypothetical protein